MNYTDAKTSLIKDSRVWLITGVAGFIGSNLLEQLLQLNQTVVGLDNFSTGKQSNLDEVENSVNPKQWAQFNLINGDIRSRKICAEATKGVEYVLHQAALGSVPRSIDDPISSNEVNISGFLNMLVASKDEGVASFVYAASSSTYGDHPDIPKVEDTIGNPLSPYAVTKYVNELYADVFSRSYGFKAIGLRYFNVFGKRQDPNGAYAAVIPKWITAMIRDELIYINGTGETSRDFCFIENTVQANILAAVASEEAKNHVYNIAVGGSTSLKALFDSIRGALTEHSVIYDKEPTFRDFRRGDVMHSRADISKASRELGYVPTHDFKAGISECIKWHLR